MARPLPLADKTYHPTSDQTHYAGRKGNVTLCGLKLRDIEQGLPTDALVDCLACVDLVQYVQTHKFDEPGQTRHGKD